MAKDPLDTVQDPFTRKCLENCKDLGKAMKEARENAGWTQKKAAEEIGTSEGYLSKCERNQQKIPIYLVIEYSRLFRVPLDDLISKVPRQKTKSSGTDYIGELNRLLPSLPDRIVRAFHLIALEYFKRAND